MFAELAINLLASAVLVAGGYLWGIYRERQSQNGQNLEEYDFYPFGIDETKSVFFDDVKFLRAVDYLLKHRNNIAATNTGIITRKCNRLIKQN